MTAFEFRPQLHSERIFLRLLEERDAPQVLALYRQNRQFLKQWEPFRPEDFFTLGSVAQMLKSCFEAAQYDQTYSFGIFLKPQPQHPQGELIGRINLNNLVRGIFQSANVGYFMDEKHNGRGYMAEAVRLIVGFAFRDIGLHRLAAGTLLHNYGSMRVLEKAGFRREGLARHYLKIDDKWQDHYLFAITVEEVEEGG